MPVEDLDLGTAIDALSNFRFTHLRHGRTRANDPAPDPTPAQ